MARAWRRFFCQRKIFNCKRVVDLLSEVRNDPIRVDEIAERIRALDAFAPGSFKAFQELTCIPEMDDIPNAETMVALLVEDNEAIVRTARALIPIAETAHDTPTADLATSRIQIHEKTAWMLRSLING